jgi:hypothetical protein
VILKSARSVLLDPRDLGIAANAPLAPVLAAPNLELLIVRHRSHKRLLRRESAKARQDHFVSSVHIARSAPDPTAAKSDNSPVNGVQEARLIQQSRDLARQELTEIAGSILDFIGDLDPTVDQRDDVLEIVAAQVIPVPTSIPCLQLGREQVRRRDRAYLLPGWKRDVPRVVKRRPLPSVLEAKDRRVAWHQVDHQLVARASCPPPAYDRA